jgi:hypothetical protein
MLNKKTIAIKISKVLAWICFLFGALTLLAHWSDLQKTLKVPVSIGSNHIFTDHWDNGYFSAEGTWVAKGETQNDELNSVKILCSTYRKTCSMAVASVNDYGFGRPYLSSSLELFDIDKWDKEVIIFKDISRCAETTYSANRETKSVTGLRKYLITKERCAPDNPKEVKYQLVDGMEVYSKKMKDAEGVPFNIFILTIALAITIFGIYRAIRNPLKTNES